MKKQQQSNSKRLWAAVALGLSGMVAVVLLVQYWMRPPVVSYDNLRYIQLLRTACSGRNPSHVIGVEKAIEIKKKEKRISESEWRHFESILGLAKQGEWELADRACVAFEKAQVGRHRTTPKQPQSHDM